MPARRVPFQGRIFFSLDVIPASYGGDFSFFKE
jgi:hypothetical protein